MKLNLKHASLFLASAITLSACTDSNNIDDNGGTSGVGFKAYIVNEGQFGAGNGDISIYNTETKELSKNVFNATNGVPVGDAVQSITFNGDKAYIVAGGSNRMEVANSSDLTSITTIDNLSIPRYMTIKGNMGYLTEWVSFGGDGRVSIINLDTQEKVDEFATANHPEKPYIHGDNLWIPCSDTNIVEVYNTVTKEMLSFFVNHGPKSFVLDKNNTLWLLCSGKPSWASGGPTTGSLIGFPNATPSLTGTKVIPFTSTDANPASLCINKAGDQLYYLFNGICNTSIDDANANTTPEYPGFFYGLAMDTENDVLYAMDAANFSDPGNTYLIHADNSLDTLFEVGVVPNGAVFQ